MAKIQLKRGLKANLPTSGMLAGEAHFTTDRKTLHVADSDSSTSPVVPPVDDMTVIGAVDAANDVLLIHDASGSGVKEKKISVDSLRSAMGVEAGADVTDTANVTASGALMDSEVDADLKTLSLPANTTISAFGASLIDDAADSNARTTLGLVIGTQVQAYSAKLAAIAGLTWAANKLLRLTGTGTLETIDQVDTIAIAASDETTDLETGTGKATFRVPYAFTVTKVRASLTTAPSGTTLIVDINEGGTSILSTKLSIDAGEKTSTTAASSAVISDSSLADDAEVTIDIDQVGSVTAGAGLKVWLIGRRT